MKKSILTALALLLAGCATTYHLPEADRSRAYLAGVDEVWEAALASVDDIGLSLVEAEEEHGRIRVDANAETVSDDQDIDFGRSKRIVRDYLKALDRRLASGSP